VSTAIDCGNCDASFMPECDDDTYCEPCDRAFADGREQGRREATAEIVALIHRTVSNAYIAGRLTERIEAGEHVAKADTEKSG
jgi:hypothetical protein